MALVACRECGKEVSSEAPVCPYCGIKTPSKRKHNIRIAVTIAVILLVVAIGVFTYHRLTRSFAINIENTPPAKTVQPANSSGKASRHSQAATPAPKPPVVYTQQDTIRSLLDSGMTPLQISKKLGIRWDEVKRIKREKRQQEKAPN